MEHSSSSYHKEIKTHTHNRQKTEQDAYIIMIKFFFQLKVQRGQILVINYETPCHIYSLEFPESNLLTHVHTIESYVGYVMH